MKGSVFILACAAFAMLCVQLQQLVSSLSGATNASSSRARDLEYIPSNDDNGWDLSTAAVSQRLHGPGGPLLSHKPTMAIHVGPSKTATNTIQYELHDMKKVLAQDNYLYLGQYKATFPLARRGGNDRHRSFIQASFLDRRCLVPMKKYYLEKKPLTNLDCWKRVHDEIRRRAKEQQNVILSSEFVSSVAPLGDPDMFAALAQGLKQAMADDWNVFVVVAYRRYFEWVSSAFRQENAVTCLHKKAGWGGKGHCGNAWDHIKGWMERKPPSAKNYYYTDTIVDRWSKVFNVKVLNYHSPGHITTKFLCDVLPNAPNSCAYTKMQPTSKANSRESATGAYSTIATVAFKKGLLNGSKSRNRVVKEMDKYFQGQLNLPFRHLPLTCPPRKELEKLLDISLAFEDKLLPEWHHSPDGEEAHRKSFWDMAEEKKEYCSVNIKDVFQNRSTWEEVFQYLANREFS